MKKNVLIAALALTAFGQQQEPVDTRSDGRVDQRVGEPAVGPQVAKSEVQPTTYTLGPEDQILVKVLDADEISTKDNAPIRIDSRGTITLPMIGRLTAAGLTTDQLEVEIETRLKKFIHEPDVSVYLTEMRSQPISILGSVTTPGVHQLQGRKTLFEALSLAGGLKQDAGHSVKVTRRLEWGRLPLPTAQDDPTGQFSVATLKVRDIMEAQNPEENILVKPYDVISVPRAELIYVVGSVRRSGGFVLGERETISTLQALALADGHERTASLKNAKIMRAIPGTDQREEIPVDLGKLMAGKGADVPLRADDILFVPNSMAKSTALRSMEAAIQMATGVVIWSTR